MGNLTKDEVKTVSIAMTTQLGDLTEKALGGDLDSIAIIADSFIKRKDYKNAFKFYTISATRNHAHSQRKLGDMHNFSLGIPTDHKTAMMWYKKAYDNGCNTSGSIIAALYFRGYGVPMDKSKTMEWLLKAGNAGSFAAQYNIGFMYQMGLCTEKNIQLAIHFYQKSADKGSEQAKTKLKELNEKGYYLINIGKDTKIISSLENRLECIEKEILESEEEKHKLESKCRKMSKKIGQIKSINTILETHRSKQNSNIQNTEKEMLKMVLKYVGSNEFMDNNGYYNLFSDT